MPQFHPIPENDEWWGKGFTEWSNVGKALPNYEGHYQPHCPIHLGYYDLRIREVMEEQVKLAKNYGLSGFSFYFYWFDGKTLLEKPIVDYIENKKIDFPFCLTWANENWSRRWDGQENDVLIAQNHSDEDSLSFINYLMKYFKDSRYIKIDGKPILIVYRANIIPNIEKNAKLWRKELEKNGFPGLYLIAAQTFGIDSPEQFGFDASVEFPPHTVISDNIKSKLNIINKNFNGNIYDYNQVVDNAVKKIEPSYKLFRSLMLSWDNTARKQDSSHIFHGFSLLKYKQWLNSLCANVVNNKKYNSNEKIVFVNAWNEWAEGTHLEPDRKYGFGYLEATRKILATYQEKYIGRPWENILQKRHDVAVIVHLHYIELWPLIKNHLKNFGDIGFDLYITVTDQRVIKDIKFDYPNSSVWFVENRGRDVLPFIDILRMIHGFNYTAICKVHSKKSVYRQDGEKLRDSLFSSLLKSNVDIKNIVAMFASDSLLGVLVPDFSLIPHSDHNMTYDAEIVGFLSKRMNIEFEYGVFPAGSMFWFRQSALSRILYIDKSFFDVEKGLADGTVAHGLERLFCIMAEKIGYKVKKIASA